MAWQGNGMGVAWARHATSVCESTFNHRQTLAYDQNYDDLP